MFLHLEEKLGQETSMIQTDLKLYEVDGQWKAEIDVHITAWKVHHPSKSVDMPCFRSKAVDMWSMIGSYAECEWRFLGKEGESALEVARSTTKGTVNPDMSLMDSSRANYPSSQDRHYDV